MLNTQVRESTVRRENQSHQRAKKIHWGLGYQGTFILQGRKATGGFRRDRQSQPENRVQHTGVCATTTRDENLIYREATRSLMRNTKALIKLLTRTTPLGDLSEGMPDYRDVDPPNTESSEKSTHAGGDEDCPAGEAKIEVFSKHSARGAAPQ